MLSRILNTAGVLSVCLMLTLFSCKKKEEPKEEPAPEPTEEAQSSTDSRDAQSENDAAVNDINNVIGDQPKLHGRTASGSSSAAGITGTICSMTVDTAGLGATGAVKLNFSGITCNNRTRTGTIKLTVVDYVNGKRWKHVGCSIKVEYINYKITRASDQKSIQLDGIQYLTNVSGGTWWELLIVKTQTSLVHSVTGSALSVKFSDGKTAIYNINRRITYSIPNNVITCKAEGIGSFNGINNLENYGTTRNGAAFTSEVNTPIIWNLTCGTNAPIQGDVSINVPSKAFGLRVLFGTDQSGTPVNVAANSCAYGWKLEWMYNGKQQSKVFGYN